MLYTYIPLTVLLLPLAASAVQIFAGRRLPRGGDWVSTGAILAGFALSLPLLAGLLAKGDPHFRHEASVQWIAFGDVTVTMGILVDNLTAFMLTLVTGIAACVHFFSVYYMKEDKNYHRYFGYLSFFCFSMLGIVIADNFLMIFMFWELVGFSSYALIGFWFEREAAAEAQKKAFVVNRIGDLGFLVGLMIVFSRTGDFRLTMVFEAASAGAFEGQFLPGISILTALGIAFFLGAMGKSAQFPLHVWLPDAMEGPTPVSSLIHAATMVAAGVFFTARIFPLMTPGALLFVTLVGALTAFMAATIALVQRDIKRVLAYSTVSQLGYMMLGMGCGGYTAGLTHLFTHAFFKCLLFLCAGSVIHALGTQDLFRMGGLRKKMPITFATMLLGTLAITGVPLFSGFVSKDAILTEALARYLENPGSLRLLIFTAGMLTAVLTAFYMFRLLFLAFFGKPRERTLYDRAHEAPPVATVPLAVLALFTLGFFWSGTVDIPLPGHGLRVPVVFIPEGWLGNLLPPPALDAFAGGLHGSETPAALLPHGDGGGGDAHEAAHGIVSTLSLLSTALGFLAAWLCYVKGALPTMVLRKRLHQTALFLENLWYVERLYQRVFVEGLHRLSAAVFRFDGRIIDGAVNGLAGRSDSLSRFIGVFDNTVIDRAVNLAGEASQNFGHRLSRLQSGKIQNYIFLGLLALCCYVLIGVM
jgi:NADH-quinone oxidoreductase subunit L